MRYIISIFILLFFICFVIANITTINGGDISSLLISLNQTNNKWFAFWGTSTNSSNFSSLTINNDTINNADNSTRSLVLPTPNATYYFLTLNSSPSFGKNFSAPNLDDVNTLFDLTGSFKSQILFNETSNYTLYTSLNNTTTLALPTSYLSGKYDNGSINDYSFKEGIVSLDGDILFIVPHNRSKGFDGTYYDYQIILPYSSTLSNKFYLFYPYISSYSQQSNADFNWSYDGTHLIITTLPSALVSIYDQMGKSYSGTASSLGVYSVWVPSGTLYDIIVSKTGYNNTSDKIYIPEPISYESSDGMGGGPVLIIKDIEKKNIICISEDCYGTTTNSPIKLDEIKEIACEGDTCKLIDTNKNDFVDKYHLEKIPLRRPVLANSDSKFNVESFLLNAKKTISSQFEDMPLKDTAINAFALVFILIAFLAVFVFRARQLKSRRKKIGYD